MQHRKRVWTTPEITVHGNVEQLTQQTINKQAGSGDQVCIAGVGCTTIPQGGPVISVS